MITPRMFVSLMAATALALGAGACGGDEEADTAASTTAETQAVDTAALGPQAAELQKLYEAARQGGEDQVVVYAGQYTLMKPVFDAFTKRFPDIKITGKDTFGAPMETTIGQEVTGKPAQRGDIAHTADTTMLNLADKDLLQAYRPPAATGVEGDQLVYKDNVLTAANYSFFGNMVNTEVVKDAPSWESLLRPEVRGKVLIQDPTKAGSGNGILTTLANDDRFGIEYARRLKANGVVSAATYPELLNKVVDGTYGVAMYGGYTAYLGLKEKGAPVDFVFPVEGGVWIPIEYFGLIKNAPHPNAAKLLMNFFYTPEGAKALTSIGAASAVKDAPTPEGIPPIADIEQLNSTPLETRIENQEKYTKQLTDIFG